jgi:FMN reductase (NADPH)/FMN reductase [NAD(P)H]
MQPPHAQERLLNSTLELLEKRRSIRLYDPTPLTQAEKDAILHAAMRAPTAGAMMLYTIIEVNDPLKKAALAESCDHQAFIAAAPYLLLFLADYQRWSDLYEAAGCAARAAELGLPPRNPAEGDLMLAFMDALIAAQTAVIAAESLGIGSCYIGDIIENWETHQALFDLPRYTFPAVLICFGRASRTPPGGPSPRFYRPSWFRNERIIDDYQAFSDCNRSFVCTCSNCVPGCDYSK